LAVLGSVEAMLNEVRLGKSKEVRSGKKGRRVEFR